MKMLEKARAKKTVITPKEFKTMVKKVIKDNKAIINKVIKLTKQNAKISS